MRLLRKQAHSRARCERGSIISLSAIGVLAILGAATLAIDVSHLYLVSGELQNAADAAAFAGASALNGGAAGITTAVDRAIVAMNSYEFNHTTVTLARDDVTFAVNLSDFDTTEGTKSEEQAKGSPTNIRFVRVKIPAKTITTVVAKAVLGSTTQFTVSRTAIAGQSVCLNQVGNFTPLAVIDNEEGYVPNPPAPPPALNPEADSNCTDSTLNHLRFYKGCTYTLHSPSSSVHAGDYLLLTLGTARGGTDLRDRLAIGVDGVYTTTLTTTTDGGLQTGKVNQGMNTRFDVYAAGLDPSVFPPDFNIKENITYAQYKGGAAADTLAPSHTAALYRRVIVLPVVSLRQYVTNNGGRDNYTGGVSVTFKGYIPFFLRQSVPNGNGNNGGDLRVEYVGDQVVIGNGGSNGGACGSYGANLTVPVLYR